MKPNKLFSRKWFTTLLGIGLSMKFPALIPILKILVPSYVGIEGLVDLTRIAKNGEHNVTDPKGARGN